LAKAHVLPDLVSNRTGQDGHNKINHLIPLSCFVRVPVTALDYTLCIRHCKMKTD
jgi:hypothetical protein